MNIYDPFPNTLPALTTRSALAARILQSLQQKNVSIVGRKHYGKSVLIRHLAEKARSGGQFAHVVEWDLRHFTPEDDTQFFRGLCEQLSSQLTGKAGEDVRVLLAAEEDQTPRNIGEVLKFLQHEGEDLLLVLDGLDAPLSSPGLSKNVWDYLCGFTDIGSLRLLAGSRERLRELCINPESKTSDFFRRFEDPPTQLKALTDEELREFLAPLAERRPLDKGAISEFSRQSGGIPILCAALAGLLQTGNDPIGQPEVKKAADQLIESESESIPEAFGALNHEEQAAFSELCHRQQLKSGQGKLTQSLIGLGVANGAGGHLSPNCELLKSHVGARAATLCSMHDLFGDESSFNENITPMLLFRYQQTACDNEGLDGFLSHALSRLKDPASFLTTIRGFLEHSLQMVWDVEAPTGEPPRYTSENGLTFLRKCQNGRLPTESYNLLRALDLLTDDRNGVTPKKANRKIYCLVNSLKAFGDLGQHQKGVTIGTGLAAFACLAMIELSNELVAAGFANSKS